MIKKTIEILYRLGFMPEGLDNDRCFYRTEEDVEYLLNLALQSVVAAKKKFIQQYEAVVEEDRLLQELDSNYNN